MKKKILVFPCGSEIGLELHRALNYDRHIELYGASSPISNHGQFIYQRYYNKFPFVEEPDFLDNLNRFIGEKGIDFVIPAHDSVVLFLAEAVEAGRLHCGLLASSADTCRLCRSKIDLYKRFESLLRIAKVYDDCTQVPRWPVFLKPNVGQGSRGTYLAQNATEVGFYRAKDPSLLILEYLPGAEYTIDCFTDRKGRLLFVGGRERTRIQNGISVNTRPINNNEFERIAKVINQTLKLRGMWFFQLKLSSDGEFALLEIAPRLAGAMGLYRNLGVNFPLLTLYDALEYDVEIISNNYQIQMDRALESKFFIDIAYEHVYIDLDDCLIIDGQVNTRAVAYLYQCLNLGIHLHLLTRHTKPLAETLNKYRLQGLFETEDVVLQSDQKANYIKYKNSIFIDDSFNERMQVHKHLGIPVFATDAIESLLLID